MESNQESMVTLTGSDQVVRELAHPATGAIEAEKVTITDNKEAGVYELWVDGQTAAGLLYNEAGTRVTISLLRCSPSSAVKGSPAPARRSPRLAPRRGANSHSHLPVRHGFRPLSPQYADVVDPTFPGNARSGHGRIH